MTHAFVLCADERYLDQVETTMKSIMANVADAKVYLINETLPPEWFKRVRQMIKPFGGQLIDCRISTEQLQQYNTPANISTIAYGRLLMGQFVTEPRAVYIDVDAIVTADVSELFTLDLRGKLLAAAYNVTGDHGVIADEFNSGLLVVDVDQWKASDFEGRIFAYMNEHADQITFGDQQMLNEMLAGDFVVLDKTYNFMIGLDWFTLVQDLGDYAQVSINPLPKILHYVNIHKPWQLNTSIRTKDLWWDYRMMEWSAISSKWQNHFQITNSLPSNQRPTFFTLTNSYSLEDFDALVQAMPNYDFVVAAYTRVHPLLKAIRRYDNVTLLEMCPPILVDAWAQTADVYLDINNGNKSEDVIENFRHHQVPIVAFEDQASPLAEHLVATHDVDAMVKMLKEILTKKEEQ